MPESMWFSLVLGVAIVASMLSVVFITLYVSSARLLRARLGDLASADEKMRAMQKRLQALLEQEQVHLKFTMYFSSREKVRVALDDELRIVEALIVDIAKRSAGPAETWDEAVIRSLLSDLERYKTEFVDMVRTADAVGIAIDEAHFHRMEDFVNPGRTLPEQLVGRY